MRKALTVASIALASSMALGGAATAFAADSPATGTGPDGAKLQAAAQLTVKKGDKPTPSASGLSLSTDFGRPGDKVGVTIKTGAGEKNAFVKSDAFTGGQVNLKSDGHGTWTGTAVVAGNVKTGYYGVQAYAGGKQFDTVKFSTEGKSTPDVNPTPKPKPQPLKPSEHKKPKGSVNTGEAPVGYVAETSNV